MNRRSALAWIGGLVSGAFALSPAVKRLSVPEKQELLMKLRSMPLTQYKMDPVGYARDVLKVEMTEQQRDICFALLRPPYRVMAQACNSVGKTFIAAILANWWYDTRSPGIVISTAPSMKQVELLLWKEIRNLRNKGGRGYDLKPRACRMEDVDPDKWQSHWAEGMTAVTEEGFKGHHGQPKLVLFDEAVGIGEETFNAAESFFEHNGEDAWLCMFNPTDETSRVGALCHQLNRGTGAKPWTVVYMSAMDHPNIKAQLELQPKPFPSAVDIVTIDSKVREYCDKITDDQVRATDFQWPPQWAKAYCELKREQPKWYRPGPIFQVQCLGQWPTEGIYAVWSQADWDAVETADCGDDRLAPNNVFPEIGCDVAVMGDDWTAFHVRIGSVSLYHQRVNGWRHDRVAGRCMELCREWAEWANERLDRNAKMITPETIAVKVDDDGCGGGVLSIGLEAKYRFIGITASTRAYDESKYPNRRCELWFDVVERAREGNMALGRLDEDALNRLRSQAMAPLWWLDGQGRRMVEPKTETKVRTGTRSPDDMDAVNLAYADALRFEAPKVLPKMSKTSKSFRDRGPRRSGFLGRR